MLGLFIRQVIVLSINLSSTAELSNKEPLHAKQRSLLPVHRLAEHVLDDTSHLVLGQVSFYRPHGSSS